MRDIIIAANWKMHKTKEEGEKLIKELNDLLIGADLEPNIKIVIIPPFLHVQNVKNMADKSIMKIGVQNIHSQKEGAFTGGTSASMAKSFGAEYVIIGHSERRKYQKEDNEILKNKVKKALEFGLKPIYCCGETLVEREEELHWNIIENQIKEGLFELDKNNFSKISIAYEPVWAIGTGKTATPKQAQEIHAFIRKLISEKYGNEVAQKSSILYGGSVKANNAKELLQENDIDGALVGGASLIAKEFMGIIKPQ